MSLPNGFSWPGGALLAVSIVVNVEEGAEANVRDGDRYPEPVDELQATPRRAMRVHGNESNYQYGIKAGAPRVLRLLDRYHVPATWTAAAVALERAPELAQAIVARGDEVACHGHRWVHQYWMDEAQERQFIRDGRDVIERVCGQRPVGWLSRYLHTENTRRLLLEEGFTYHMDDFSDDLPFWDAETLVDGHPRPMLVTPYAIDTNDMKFWLAPSLSAADWLTYAIDTFDQLHAESAEIGPRMMNLGLHLRIIGRPGRIGALEGFLRHATGRARVWFASRLAIADAFAEACPAPLANA